MPVPTPAIDPNIWAMDLLWWPEDAVDNAGTLELPNSGTAGATYDLGQSTASKQPVVATRHGVPVLTPDGVNDGMTTASGSGGGGGQAETLIPNNTTAFTIWAVAEIDYHDQTNKYLITLGGTNTLILWVNNSDEWRLTHGSGQTLDADVGAEIRRRTLLVATFDGGTAGTFEINGTPQADTTLGPSTSPTGDVGFGANDGAAGAFFGPGWIAGGGLIAGTALDATARAELTARLAARLRIRLDADPVDVTWRLVNPEPHRTVAAAAERVPHKVIASGNPTKVPPMFAAVAAEGNVADVPAASWVEGTWSGAWSATSAIDAVSPQLGAVVSASGRYDLVSAWWAGGETIVTRRPLVIDP